MFLCLSFEVPSMTLTIVLSICFSGRLHLLKWRKSVPYKLFLLESCTMMKTLLLSFDNLTHRKWFFFFFFGEKMYNILLSLEGPSSIMFQWKKLAVAHIISFSRITIMIGVMLLSKITVIWLEKYSWFSKYLLYSKK